MIEIVFDLTPRPIGLSIVCRWPRARQQPPEIAAPAELENPPPADLEPAMPIAGDSWAELAERYRLRVAGKTDPFD